MKRNIWILIVILLAIAFVPLIVSGVAALVTSGVHSVTMGVHSFLNSLSVPGDKRLNSIIQGMMYIVIFFWLAKLIWPKKK